MSVPKETTPETMPEAGGEAAAGAAPTAPLAAPPNDGCGGTPWQTPGPYPPINDQADKDLDLTHIQGHANRAKGQVIYIKGRILDDHFHPVSGAIVLIWQADHNGYYNHAEDDNAAMRDPHFQGWGQVVTDEEGDFYLKTIKPGTYIDRSSGEQRAPHIHFGVFREGYGGLFTQMYFAVEPLNQTDEVLLKVKAEEREKVIVELRDGAPADPDSKRGQFNIVICRDQ